MTNPNPCAKCGACRQISGAPYDFSLPWAAFGASKTDEKITQRNSFAATPYHTTGKAIRNPAVRRVVGEAVEAALRCKYPCKLDSNNLLRLLCRITGALIHAPAPPLPPEVSSPTNWPKEYRGDGFAEYAKQSSAQMSKWKADCTAWQASFLQLVADETISLPLPPDAVERLRVLMFHAALAIEMSERERQGAFPNAGK